MMLTNYICEKLNINMTDKEKNKIIDKAQEEPVLMPDGGHCCLKMTDNCYGCGCYSTGNYKRCNERIKSYFSKLEE
jgi:2-hydroxy-3-keto-5-methylthiopentenyl-1-phosphate phosphatase